MSVILCKLGRKRAVLCSDRRVTVEDGMSDMVIPKLFQSGKYSVCGSVGLGKFPPLSRGVFDPSDFISNRICLLCANEALWDSPRALLRALHDDLHPRLSAMIADKSNTSTLRWVLSTLPPGRLLSTLPPAPGSQLVNLLTAFCFMRTPGSGSFPETIDLVALRICLGFDEGKWFVSPEIVAFVEKESPNGRPFIHNYGPRGFLSPNDDLMRLTPDLPDDHVLRTFDDIVEEARNRDAKYMAQVGFVEDVVSIGDEGFRWLRGGTPLLAGCDGGYGNAGESEPSCSKKTVRWGEG